MSLSWTNDLRVGVKKLDEQHWTFVDEFNQLLAAFRANDTETRISELIVFLENYTREHFADEERYMRRYQYPALEMHVAQHQLFVADFEKLHIELAKSGACMTNLVQLSEFMLRWFIKHIREADMKLGDYLATQGITADQ